MNGSLVLNFLNQIVRNNNREWFHAHHDEYVAAKTEVEQLIRSIESDMIMLDADLNGYTDPKTSLFRLFRDIRFSADKIPYKDHFGIFFAKGGRKVHYPGYYIHIQPDHSLLSGGVWLPEPDKLKMIRQEILYNPITLENLLNNADFQKYYSGVDDDYLLSRIPAGFPKDFQYEKYLRTKSFTFSTAISNEMICSEQFPEEIIRRFNAIQPMVNFLKMAMEN